MKENKDLKTKRKKTKTKAEIERDEYLSLLKRERADFLNFKKESALNYQKATERGKMDLLLEIIPIIDNFEMAFSNKAVWESVSKDWRVGIEFIYQKLINLLSDYGIESFTDIGKEFNPERHEAIEEEIVDRQEKDGIIISALAKGYKSQDNIFRAARVKIGKFIKK